MGSRSRRRPAMNSRLSFDEIRANARGRWPEIIGALVGQDYISGKNGPCPGCGGRDRFQFNRRSDAGAFVCRAHPRQGGDGFELLAHALGLSFAEAMRQVGDFLGLTHYNAAPRRPAPPPPAPAVDWSQARKAARGMWHSARQIEASDPAGRYLASRGLALPGTATALRFHPSLSYWNAGREIGRFPALLARISRLDGLGAGLHRSWLSEAGRKLAIDGLPARKLFKAGDLTGTAVQLAPPDAGRLAIAEGIETALAFSQATGCPCWAALSAGALARWQPPEAARKVYIAVDVDAAGEAAAAALAKRLLAAGLEVFLAPPPGAGDWNDAIRGAAHAQP